MHFHLSAALSRPLISISVLYLFLFFPTMLPTDPFPPPYLQLFVILLFLNNSLAPPSSKVTFAKYPLLMTVTIENTMLPSLDSINAKYPLLMTVFGSIDQCYVLGLLCLCVEFPILNYNISPIFFHLFTFIIIIIINIFLSCILHTLILSLYW